MMKVARNHPPMLKAVRSLTSGAVFLASDRLDRLLRCGER